MAVGKEELEDVVRPRMDRGSWMLLKEILAAGYGEATIRVREGRIDQVVRLERNRSRKDLLR